MMYICCVSLFIVYIVFWLKLQGVTPTQPQSGDISLSIPVKNESSGYQTAPSSQVWYDLQIFFNVFFFHVYCLELDFNFLFCSYLGNLAVMGSRAVINWSLTICSSLQACEWSKYAAFLLFYFSLLLLPDFT